MNRPRFEFRCPKCNGSTWGSSSESKDGVITIVERDCHGERAKLDDAGNVVITSCKYSWKPADDWKVYVQRFETEEDFIEAGGHVGGLGGRHS